MKLIDYIKGTRRGREANAIEREAMEDPFLADAIDGYESVYGSHSEIIARLEERIAKRAARKRRVRPVAAPLHGDTVVAEGTPASAERSRRGAGKDSGDKGRGKPGRSYPWLMWSAAVVLVAASAGLLWHLTDTRPSAEDMMRVATMETERIPMPDTAAQESLAYVTQVDGIDEDTIPIQDSGRSVESLPTQVAQAEHTPAQQTETPARTEKQTTAVIADLFEMVNNDTQIDTKIDFLEFAEEMTIPEPEAAKESSGDRIAVRGRVTDENNDPLIGVTVIEKETRNAAVTGVDGEYVIEAKEDAVLAFFSLGYESEERKVTRGEPDAVRMKADKSLLAETVVIGYGTGKKIDTAVEPVVAAKPTANIAEAVQGQVSGLQIETRATDVEGHRHLPDTVVNEEFMEYFRANSKLQVNPEGERTKGAVTVEFRVNDKGVPSAIQIISGFSVETNHEVIDLLVKGPLWTPTKGKRVRMVIEYE